MKSLRTAVGRLVAVVFTCTLALVAATPAHADETSDALKEIRTLIKAEDTEQAIDWIEALSDNEDKRVTKFFVGLTKHKNVQVATAAYREAAKRGNKTFLSALKKRAEDRKYARERPALYVEAIRALGVYASKSTQETLETVIQRYLPSNSDNSTAAIDAYAKLRDKSVIDRLIKYLQQAESTSGLTGTNSDAFALSRATLKNYERAHAQLLLSLTELTGLEHPDAAAWKAWWKEHEKSFVIPPVDPPEDDAAGD